MFPLLIETQCSHNVSPQRVVLPEGLPSASITPLQRYYALSDFLAVISAPLLFMLVGQYFHMVEELPGSPTFTCLLSLRAMLYDPGGVLHPCPSSVCRILLSDNSTSSATPKRVINGARSLQPDGLRPATSLSTLNLRCYQRKPKTRYRMRWVNTFPVALSATSR